MGFRAFETPGLTPRGESRIETAASIRGRLLCRKVQQKCGYYSGAASIWDFTVYLSVGLPSLTGNGNLCLHQQANSSADSLRIVLYYETILIRFNSGLKGT